MINRILLVAVLITAFFSSNSQVNVPVSQIGFVQNGTPTDIVALGENVYMSAAGGVWEFELNGTAWVNINNGISGLEGNANAKVKDLFVWEDVLYLIKENGAMMRRMEGRWVDIFSNLSFQEAIVVNGALYAFVVEENEVNGISYNLNLYRFSSPVSAKVDLELYAHVNDRRQQRLANVADLSVGVTTHFGTFVVDEAEKTELPYLNNTEGIFATDADNIWVWLQDEINNPQENELLKLNDEGFWEVSEIAGDDAIEILSVYETSNGVGVNFLQSEGGINNVLLERGVTEPITGFNSGTTEMDISNTVVACIGIAETSSAAFFAVEGGAISAPTRFGSSTGNPNVRTTRFAGFHSGTYLSTGFFNNQLFTLQQKSEGENELLRFNAAGTDIDNGLPGDFPISEVDFRLNTPLIFYPNSRQILRLDGLGEFEISATANGVSEGEFKFINVAADLTVATFANIGSGSASVIFFGGSGNVNRIANTSTIGKVLNAAKLGTDRVAFLAKKFEDGSFDPTNETRLGIYNFSTSNLETIDFGFSNSGDQLVDMVGISNRGDSVIVTLKKENAGTVTYEYHYLEPAFNNLTFVANAGTNPTAFDQVDAQSFGTTETGYSITEGSLTSWEAVVFEGLPEASAISDILIEDDGRFIISTLGNGIFASEATATSIADLSKDEFLNVYPNPASDFVVIDAKGLSLKGAKILDANGRMILSLYKNAGASLKLDISQLKPGVYLGKVELMTGETLRIKFVKH